MNITLISANSFRLIDKEIKKIIKDHFFLTINFNKSSIKEIIEEASYINLTGEEKYIVVSNANFFSNGKLNDEDNEMLLKFLSNGNSSATIIFTTLYPLDNRKKVTKICKDKYKIINIPIWDKKQSREEVSKYLQSYNYQIDYETISFLLDNTYNNIDILFNELDKIMLFYKHGTKINLKDVEEIVGREIDSNSFHFVSSVIDKDLAKSIKIWHNLQIYKTDAVSLVILLAREYRLMYYVKRLKSKGYNINNMCEELSLQAWQVTKLYNNSLKYQEKEILKNIYTLGVIDCNIKKGIFDKDTALYSFLLDACL